MKISIGTFKCTKCGDCCKDFECDSTKGKETPRFHEEFLFLLRKQYLKIYPWEKETYEGHLRKIGSKRKVLPSIVVFDLKMNTTIVICYTLDGGNCPLLKDNICSIYEDRPYVCREFPCLYPLDQIATGSFDFSKNVLCKAEREDKDLDNLKKLAKNPIPTEELLKLFRDRYGDSFYYNLGEKNFNHVFYSFFRRLHEKGIINLVKNGYSPQILKTKIENSNWKDIHEYVQEKTGKKLEESMKLPTIKKMIINHLNKKSANFAQ